MLDLEANEEMRAPVHCDEEEWRNACSFIYIVTMMNINKYMTVPVFQVDMSGTPPIYFFPRLDLTLVLCDL